MSTQDKPEGVIFLTFPSLSKCVEYATSPVTTKQSRASLTVEDRKDKFPFYGTATFDEAVDLANKGWEGPRTDVNLLVDRVREHVQRYTLPAFVPVFDVSGGEVDVDRFLMGEPENMIEQTLMPIAKHGKVVRLIAAGAVSCGISEETIKQRGAAVVSLIDALRMAQHTLEIWVHFGITTFRGGEWHAVVRLKAAEDDCDIDSLMYALAHPSMLRRIMFSVMEHEPSKVRDKFGFVDFGGYGHPLHRIPEWITSDDDRPFDVVVDNAATDNIDRSAEQWLDGVLHGLGIVKEGA